MVPIRNPFVPARHHAVPGAVIALCCLMQSLSFVFLSGCVSDEPGCQTKAGDSAICRCHQTSVECHPIERISSDDLEPLAEGMPGERGLKRTIEVAPGVLMQAVIEVTAKGNGSLRIGNLDIKVFDGHDDGIYYENGLLSIEFTDINGDGKRELVVFGIVVFTDEKGNEVLRREPIVLIYALAADKTFRQVYRNTDLDLPLN